LCNAKIFAVQCRMTDPTVAGVSAVMVAPQRRRKSYFVRTSTNVSTF
jgi:hypothetical protein